MNPVTVVIVPGMLGGLFLAILSHRRRGPVPRVILPHRTQWPSTDVINMASIKVAGVGGLCLVAMAGAVALDVPEIGQSIAISLGLGTLWAVLMIVRSRRRGPMPSSGQRIGANTTLSIDQPERNSSDIGSPREPGIRLAEAR